MAPNVNLVTSGQAVTAENLLLYEMRHRVSNELSSAIGILSIAAARSKSNEAQAALTAARDRLQNYVGVHHSLQKPEYNTTIDLSVYLRQLCKAISRSKLESCGIELSLSLYPVRMSSERCWLLGMIVFELITNAARHAFGERSGAIHLELLADESLVECRITDDGRSEPNAEPGCGLKIVEALARRLSGSVDVRFGAGGTRSVIVIPKDLHFCAQIECK